MTTHNCYKYTNHIALIGRGVSDTGQRFVKLQVHGDIGTKTIVVRENCVEQYKHELEGIGANLVSAAASAELVKRIQEKGLETPTFEVATHLGFKGDSLVLPGGAIPRAKNFEIALTDVPAEIQQKYCRAGTLKGWKELARHGRGNTRMMLAYALMFVGPVSHILPIEHVGVQLVGEGGSGVSTIGIAASSAWGWDSNPVLADRNGFGHTWNSTVNKLEKLAAGHNQTALFLNETGLSSGNQTRGAENVVEGLLRLECSAGKGRLNEATALSYFVPLLSTSNVSVLELARLAGIECVAPYVDRLIDVPIPENGCGAFEELHGFENQAALAIELKRVAAENHGVVARQFVRRMMKWLKSDRKSLVEYIQKRRAFYIRRARKLIASPTRDLTRVHGKMATIYAVGSLAIYLRILPFKRPDLLAAILTCEADHVAFIDAQASGADSSKKAALESVRDFLAERRGSFVDLADSAGDIASASGFIGRRKGSREILLENAAFELAFGGKLRADRVKASLAEQKLLATEAGNDGRPRFVVRRKIGGKRRWVIAFDARILEGEP